MVTTLGNGGCKGWMPATLYKGNIWTMWRIGGVAMTVLALDEASITTGYAVFQDNRLMDSGIIKARQSDNADKRITYITQSVLDLIKKWHVSQVAIEDLQFEKQNIHSLVILCRLQGALQYACIAAGVACSALAPATWRSRLGWKKMKREEAKAYSVAWVQDKYQLDVNNDDEADAICIGTAFLK